MEPRFEALVNILKDEQAAQKLLALSAEEAAVVLKEQYSLEFTAEELEEVAAGIKQALSEGPSDELSCDQLEAVVGGKKSTAYYVGYYVGKTVIAGCVIIGAVAVVTGTW